MDMYLWLSRIMMCMAKVFYAMTLCCSTCRFWDGKKKFCENEFDLDSRPNELLCYHYLPGARMDPSPTYAGEFEL